MIAGVWAPDSASKIEAVVEQMARFVRRRPSATVQGSGFALACWSFSGAERLDALQRLAVVGFAQGVPEKVVLEDAARLAGDYALIHGKADGLLLARGRHAGRCLYFARLPGGAVAATSRLEPLVACLTSGVTPNLRTLAALILAQPPDDLGATVFQEVRRVEASQAILVASGGILGSFRAPIEVKEREGSPDELADEIRAALDRAIRRSIEPRRRVAILVSGGLDSTSVLAGAVAIARGASRAEVDAITWSFAGPGDDRPYLAELCESLGVVPLRISSADLAQRVDDALVVGGAPGIWPTMPCLLLAHEWAYERGAEVLLTGMGGDQVFDGDPRVVAQHAVAGHWRQAVQMASRLHGESLSQSLFRTARTLLAPQLIRAVSAGVRLKRRRHVLRRWPWAGPRLRETLTDMYVRVPHDTAWMNPTNRERFQRLVSKDLLHVAETRGQIESVTPLLRIDPLLDDELVSIVAGLSQEALLFGLRRRGLFRHAMRQRLPERLRLRPDKARFGPGLAEMIRGCDLRRLRQLSKMRFCGELGLVDPRSYSRHFERLLAPGGDPEGWAAAWPALTVEAFVRSRWDTHRRDEPWRASA